MAFITSTSKGIKAITLLLSILLLGPGILFFIGQALLHQYGSPYTVEWAGEADSIHLQFEKSDPYSGRFLLVPYTAFGKRMIDEYIKVFKKDSPGILVDQTTLYSAIAAYPQSMDYYRLFDYFVLVNIELKHYWAQIFSNRADLVMRDSATPPTPRPFFEPVFTRGLYQQPDNALVDHLRHLIQQAPAGSEILFSVFLFYYENPDEPILLDILAAAERGVNIQLITDLPEAENPTNRGIGQAFQDAFKLRLQAAAAKGHSTSWLKEHGNVAWDSKNHTKIFLFSDSAGEKNWTILTSENLTDREREKYQAGIIIRDKQTYDDFKIYWREIRDGSYKNLWVSSNGKTLSHYFFPQLSGNDVIYQLLSRIKADPSAKTQGVLKISMARWNFERFPLAMKLVQLAEAGIQIEIVTRNNPEIVDTAVLEVLSHRPNITLHTANVDKLNIHSKYVLFEGRYQDSADNGEIKKILWVGSHNFTGMAMRNNYETWSEIRDQKLFADFSENFSELTSLVPVDASSENSKP